MRKAVLLAAALLFFALSLQAQQISGDYIESRSTDVYVAQCFANGEVGLTGNFALMAWHVQEGSWDGVHLDGLTVAAAVRARATLGDPYGDPYPAEAVLMVDDTANPAQRSALIALAQHEGGRLLENLARIEYVPVVLDVPQATSAVALTDEFRGDGLGSQWSMHGKRSAYIASFSEGGSTVASMAMDPAMH